MLPEQRVSTANTLYKYEQFSDNVDVIKTMIVNRAYEQVSGKQPLSTYSII
jgi:hypothetical protein